MLGSLDHPISTVEVYGDLVADGESLYEEGLAKAMTTVAEQQGNNGGPGGGSGGSLLLFLTTMTMGNMSLLSSVGGHGGLLGGGGGGGGRVHFHWSNIATGEDFVPLATGQGLITTWWVGCLLVFSLLLNSSIVSVAVTMYMGYIQNGDLIGQVLTGEEQAVRADLKVKVVLSLASHVHKVSMVFFVRYVWRNNSFLEGK